MEMTRYWVTDDGIIVREWTEREYRYADPTQYILEDVLWNVCINCGHPFSIATHIVKDADGDNPHKKLCRKCYNKKYNLFFKPKNRNNGYAYITTKLRCFENTIKDIDGKQRFVTRLY
jgi:hypothetical protein